MTWTEDMLELWHDEVAEFGATATYESWTFDCIKNPIQSTFMLTPHAYDKQADTVIDMLRSDAITNGIYALVQNNPIQKRPVLTISGNTYEVQKMENDELDQPSIRLTATKLQ